MRLAGVGAAGGVAAEVAHAHGRVEHGRDPGGAGAQAQVHVLEEEELARVERAETPQDRGARRDARGDRPADRARALGAVGLGALAQRARQRGRVGDRGQQRAERARERVRGALDRPVGLEQPRDPEAVGADRGGAGEPVERPVEQLAVGVEQDGDRLARTLDARVVGRAEARVGTELDHLGARGAGERGALVARAASTTTS